MRLPPAGTLPRRGRYRGPAQRETSPRRDVLPARGGHLLLKCSDNFTRRPAGGGALWVACAETQATIRTDRAHRRCCGALLRGPFLLPFAFPFRLAVTAAVLVLFTLAFAFPFALHLGTGTAPRAGAGTRTGTWTGSAPQKRTQLAVAIKE